MLMMNLKNDECKCHLLNVLYVPSMAYNLGVSRKLLRMERKQFSRNEIINI